MQHQPRPIARHFRQILTWPLQLVGDPNALAPQAWWEQLAAITTDNPWQPLDDEFSDESPELQERHYREFVTFLPHVQRFLYGQGRSPAARPGYGESPIRVFRRHDIAQLRLSYDDGASVDFAIQHVDLYFFYDIDVMILALEFHANDLPLDRVQDTLFRFGRSFPTGWDEDGTATHCMPGVQWLGRDGQVQCESDFLERERYLAYAGEHRSASVGTHWQFLLEPMVQHFSNKPGALRYRQLEYHRIPRMTYLSFDDPFAIERDDFYRLALNTRPDDGKGLEISERALVEAEEAFYYDRFWMPDRASLKASTRVMCNGHALTMVGSARDPRYIDVEHGLLGQFRHQYFLVTLIAHFHKAALLLISDRQVVSVSRLQPDDPDSVRRFKRNVRRSLETFLRFNHRYWFHELSNQVMARDLFRLLSRHLRNDELFAEVREEVLDMSQYLDSDDSRRQAESVLRLTVVTIFGMIGTIVTGFLGMNLFALADMPWPDRVGIFAIVLVPSILITLLTVQNSRALSAMLDTIGNDRLDWKARLALIAKGYRRRRLRGG
ncbi:MAG: CorA family divalent cation transporter [Lautropia sp.]